MKTLSTLFLITGITLVLTGCDDPITEDPVVLASLPEEVDFNYHIRPLLSDRCFACHGPDENTREAGLRLDTEEGAFGPLKESPGRAIVPGKLNKSVLVGRIEAHDDEEVMPPPESKLSLTEYEIALLKKWIKQGAEWKSHWAFTPPVQPELPTIC